MLSEESIADAQDNELEALSAIYGKDLHDLRKTRAWGKWQPLMFILSLTPQRGSTISDDAKVDLHVTCTDKYPNEAPQLHVQNAKRISQGQVQQLVKELVSQAERMVGEVMIFELAQYVQEYLYKNSKPASKSFYEEMHIRQEQQQLARQQKLEKEHEKLVKQYEEREELHKQANKRQGREGRKLSENSSSSNGTKNVFCNDSSNDSNEDAVCVHDKLTIDFVNIQVIRGQCLEHLSCNCINFSAMDLLTGQLYNLFQWSLENISDETISKQINAIEQEAKHLLKFKHANLINYVNFHQSLVGHRIVVNLLSEFTLGSNCNALYVSKGIQVEIDMLRRIIKSVLSALDYLHRNNIVHKNVCASSVFICNSGQIKLSNFSVFQRLIDIANQSTNGFNYSKKADILKFGSLILSLIKGVNEDDNMSIPFDISLDLRDFIEKCVLRDDHRYSSVQLMEHTFLKVPLQKPSPVKKLSIPSDNFINAQVDHIKYLTQTNLNGQSRFETEFETLDYIGRGAYGQVFKVRNKLDQRVYAVKSIQLNTKSKLMNRKIVREVKLLSGLNHENVVRYYNSWIETATVEISDDEGNDCSTTPSPMRHKYSDSSLEKIANKGIAWSVSMCYGKSSKSKEESEGDDESVSSDDNWSLSDDDFQIEFDVDDKDTAETVSKKLSEASTDASDKSQTREIQMMYIQMEFCDKSTLRTAIDNNLYKEKERLWRLFREIIEGLSHIHQQGMIHRDLKPMNIFLDSYDHVKIGDFGLATSNLFTKTEQAVIEAQMEKAAIKVGGDQCSMTGHIGTALYVAPELSSTAKATYNQKVDIYSLGIIFFEMCYKPCKTQSERIQLLSKLRAENVTMPPDFEENGSSAQKQLIKWLLHHKPINRPTAQELLQSEHIPPPILEERELRELVRHTLKNPQLKAYKYLVESCLNQPISTIQDISYDKHANPGFSLKGLQTFNHVRDMVINVFKLHGAQELSTPLLMPKCKYYEHLETKVRLMTHSGSVVTIPHDLRVPFARYVAWNCITSLRRFSVGRVFREKRAFGFIPRELYECAFDIITPTIGNQTADAEVLYILDEIVNGIPILKDKNFLIRLNHTSILKAILLHCGIKDKHSEFYEILAEAREGNVTKIQVRTHLISNGVSANSITTLFKFLACENSIGQISNSLQTIIKKKETEAAKLAKQGLQDLRRIIEEAEVFGVNINIVINLGLVFSVPQYSGMVCQLVCDTKRKHKPAMEVLAAGGRYDDLINNYKSIMLLPCKENQSGVGISISLDRLVQVFAHRNEDESEVTHLDAIVAAFENSLGVLKQVAKILKDLRTMGFRVTYVTGTTLKEITEQSEELNAHYVVIYKDGKARVHHSKNTEKLQWFALNELIENFQRLVKSTMEHSTDLINSAAMFRPENRIIVDNPQLNVNIIYLMYGGEKLNPSTKKRYDYNINLKMKDAFNNLRGDLTIFGMNVDGSLICFMACYLNFESEADFYESVDLLKERYSKYKKYLDEKCKAIYTQKMKPNNTIVLFSLEDSVFRVFL